MMADLGFSYGSFFSYCDLYEQKVAFPPKMCYAMLLWMFGCHQSLSLAGTENHGTVETSRPGVGIKLSTSLLRCDAPLI
uniref:SFRICE_009362 n=1 Tax=Spodoptera frugiperda TaxID=7108 RepID=A0A2H1VGI9_SPOFR